MAEIPAAIRSPLKRFVSRLRQERRIEAVYLFGSQCRGAASEWSDIDVAVISPDFAGNLFQARVALLSLAAQVDDRIEPVPFAPEDFVASDPLASEVLRTGVRVA